MSDALTRSAQLNADRTAVRVEGREITYGELDEITSSIASEIVDRVGPDEKPVAVVASRGLAQILGVLSSLKAGKIYAVLDPENPQPRLARMIGDLAPELTLADKANLKLVRSLAPGADAIVEVDAARKASDRVNVGRSPDRPAGIYYTSGSTGDPKGAVLSQRGLLHFALTYAQVLGMTRASRIPLLMSCGYSWSISTLFGGLLAGGTIYPFQLKEASIPDLISFLAGNEISLVQITLGVLRPLMAHMEPADPRLRHVRLIQTGGERLYRRDIERWKDLLVPGCPLCYVLGSTEAGMIAYRNYDHESPIPEVHSDVGFPAPDKEIMIVDEEHRPVPTGEIGEIAVRSAYLVDGYWKRPELTAATLELDPEDKSRRILYSKDIGRFGSDGSLELMGRRDKMVKISGYRIVPAEIEAVLSEIPGVKECVVVGRWPSRRSPRRRLVAYIAQESGSSLTSQEVRVAVAARLPDFMVPRFVVFVDRLPLGSTGKVDWLALPDPAEQSELSPADLPADDLEVRLKRIWEEVFERPAIGVHDSFFDLGGDSLLALTLLTAIERELSASFRPTVFLDHPTIRSFARLVRGERGKAASPVIAVKKSGSKKPIFWIPSGFGADLYVHRMAPYLDREQPLYLLAVRTAGSRGFFLIEELAQYYAQVLEEHHPQGPVYLIGHSSGGTIACETARELQKRGREIGWVGLLDTVPPGSSVLGFLGALRLFRENVGPLGFRLAFKDMRRNLFVGVSKLTLGASPVRQRLLRTRKMPVLSSWNMKSAAYASTTFISGLYHPEPFVLDLVLFRATGLLRYRRDEVSGGWRRFTTRSLKIVDVPGDHVSIMEEPHVGTLAQKICDLLGD